MQSVVKILMKWTIGRIDVVNADTQSDINSKMDQCCYNMYQKSCLNNSV